MGQVVVEFGRANSFEGPARLELMQATGHKIEELASAGTHAATTIAANIGDAAVVINAGASPVWATFALAPEATVGSGHFIPGNTVRAFGNLGGGMKCSVIDDS